MASTRNRIERLETQASPASRVKLDFSALSDADLEFIESIGAKVEPTDGGKPDLSRLTIVELLRMRDLIGENMVQIPAP